MSALTDDDVIRMAQARLPITILGVKYVAEDQNNYQARHDALFATALAFANHGRFNAHDLVSGAREFEKYLKGEK